MARLQPKRMVLFGGAVNLRARLIGRKT